MVPVIHAFTPGRAHVWMNNVVYTWADWSQRTNIPLKPKHETEKVTLRAFLNEAFADYAERRTGQMAEVFLPLQHALSILDERKRIALLVQVAKSLERNDLMDWATFSRVYGTPVEEPRASGPAVILDSAQRKQLDSLQQKLAT